MFEWINKIFSKKAKPINSSDDLIQGKILEEFDLILQKNFFLGKLLLISDSQKRLAIKFSLGYKVNILFSTKNPDRYNTSVGEVFATKEIPSGSSLEYSYKFTNKKLEMKNEISGGSIERSFYDVAIPATSPLLILRISDISILRSKVKYKNPLFIDKDIDSQSLAISLSFPASNGDPWQDEVMKGQFMRQTEIPLPENTNPSKFFILASHDPYSRGDGITIWIPEHHIPTKTTS